MKRTRVRYGRVTALAVALVLAVPVFGSLVGGNSAEAGVRRHRVVVVAPGDTLWSIAERSADGDPRAAIAAIQELNDLGSSTIAPGQRLRLP